jgi:hypothetical protein
VATWLVLYQFMNMLTFFDLQIGLPYVPFGVFPMEPSQLEKETFSDLGYQNLHTWTNAMPASGW